MSSHLPFPKAVTGLLAGDFSRLDPLFESSTDGTPCPIVQWFENGDFQNEPAAAAEALACACFNGRTEVAEYLLDRGVQVIDGFGTGMNGFHWAANRGQLETVRILIARRAPLETENMYGGTVLGCTVWSALHEPRAGQIQVIAALLAAGADPSRAGFPTGNPAIDTLFTADAKRAELS